MMTGQTICPILATDVLYPMTFPTSRPARAPRSDPTDGWNDHIPSGKNITQKYIPITEVFRANQKNDTVSIKNAI